MNVQVFKDIISTIGVFMSIELTLRKAKLMIGIERVPATITISKNKISVSLGAW